MKVPIPGSLLAMSADDAAIAVWIFSQLLKYMGLTNKEANRQRKLSLLREIVSEAKGKRQLENEVYMQLVKQTRRNSDPIKQKNAWKAFIDIAEAMPLLDVNPDAVVYQLTILVDRRDKSLFGATWNRSGLKRMRIH